LPAYCLRDLSLRQACARVCMHLQPLQKPVYELIALRPAAAPSSTFFHFFFTRPKKKVKKIAVTHEKFSNPKKIFTFKFKPPKCTFHFFSLWANMGVVSGVPQRGSPSCKTPRNPLFGVLYVGKNIYLGRTSEETKIPYMVCTRDLCSCSTSW